MRSIEIKKQVLISERWNDQRLSLLESQHIIPFVSSIERYIAEAKLTPDQIQQLFTDVEKGATAAGGNRTLAGKAKDIAGLPIEAVKFIDKKINELGAALKNAGPVKNMDAKFNDLKAKIGAKDTKVVNAIKSVSDWAKANPGKATVAVAILTTAAAMAGGPLGGAIAGFLARATKDLLQGADLSTAIGKSVKTAAYGAIAGWALQGIGDWLEGIRYDQIPYEKMPELTKFEIGFNSKFEMPGFTSTRELGIISIPTDQVEEFTGLLNTMAEATAATGSTSNPAALDAFDQLWRFAKSFDPTEYMADKEFIDSVLQQIAAENDTFLQTMKVANDAIAAAAQGTISGKLDPNEIKVNGKPLEAEEEKSNVVKGNESKKFTALQIETIIEWCNGTPQVLTEGPMDALKKGAAAVGGAIKRKAAQIGKNITTKVTADKLNKAWAAAGKPDDSDAIADILRKSGVSDEVIAPIYKQMGATLPTAPKSAQPAPAQGGTSAPAQGGTSAPAGQSAAPAQGSTAPAAGTMDFKGIQQAIAKLDKAQAQELVKHIDSLSKSTPQPAAQSKQPAQATQTPQAEPAAAPAQGQADTTAQGQTTATAAPKNAAAGDTYEKAKGDIRKVQSGTKPLPEPMAAGISADIAKLAKGDKESGVAAADKIMKFAQRGMDISKLQQAWIANSKAGERFLTQSQYFEISKMLREHGLRWSDLGLRIHLLEGTNKYFGISKI